MENLNLFGVPLSDLDIKDLGGKRESVKEQNQRRQFVRELIDVMDALDVEQDADGVGLVQDFEKPKHFLHFDPYAGSEAGLSEHAAADADITALRYEDKFKLRASIVLSAYHNQLE